MMTTYTIDAEKFLTVIDAFKKCAEEAKCAHLRDWYEEERKHWGKVRYWFQYVSGKRWD